MIATLLEQFKLPPVNFNPSLKAPQAAAPSHWCYPGPRAMIGNKKLLILSSISILFGFGKTVDILEPTRSTPAQHGCLRLG